MNPCWSTEADEKLIAFWKDTKLPVVDFMSHFPGRTEAAIRQHARRLGCATRGPGPKPVIEKAVLQMIRKNGPICSAEMARKLLCASQQVDQYVRRLRKQKKIYVGGYVERHENKLSRLWVYGKGPDAAKPSKDERPSWKSIAPATPTFKADPLMSALYRSARRVSSPARESA
jgi:hypothetical protein